MPFRSLLLAAIALACLATPAWCANVVMLTANSGSLTSEESARKTQFEAWGHTVTTLWDGDSQTNFDAAVASADVVYFPEDSSATDVGYKLRTAVVGIVTEEPYHDAEMGFSTSDGYVSSVTNQILVTDNSHSVSTGLANGFITIFSSAQPRALTRGTIASGFQTLATGSSGDLCLGVIEVGGALANTYSGNSTASGRRVRLPWGGSAFAWSSLDSDGLLIAQQAIEWAAGANPLVLHYKLDETSGATASDSSASGNDGALTASGQWTSDGPRGGGLDFEVDDGVDRIDATGPQIDGDELSVAIWFNQEEPRNDARMFINSSSNSGADQSWGITVDQNGNLDFRVKAGGVWDRVEVAGVVTPGVWRHAVGVYDGVDMRLYLDGELIGTKTHTAGGDLDYDASHTVTLGDSPVGGRAFDGKLEDARVYSKALSEAEITTLYGLVGHWVLNESSGTTAADSTLNNNDGAHGSGVTVGVAGPSGGLGAYYDGGNNFTDVAHGGDWNAVDNRFTLATWVRLDTGSDLHGLVVWSSVSSPYALIVNSFNQPSVRVNWASGSPGISHDAAGSLTVGEWHHVAVTYDGSTVTFYIDGVADSNTLSSSVSVDASTDKLQIGGDDGSAYDLTGALQDVRVYNRALSADEVASLADTGATGLVGHWKLDDATGTTATDSSDKENHGTLNNSPVWTTGRFGGALEFDGSNDYVEVPHIDGYLADEGTVTLWFKADTTSGEDGLFSKDSSGYDTGGHVTISRDGDDVAVRLQSDASSYTIRASNIVTTGQWYFVAFQWGADGMRLLVDNVEYDTDSYTGGLGTSSGDIGNYEPIAIGGSAVYSGNLTLSGLSGYFDGCIDDVRFYAYRLSDSELNDLYAGGDNLVLHLRLDETSGVTAVDSSSYGNDGSTNGALAWGVSALRGTGATFDYTDGEDYVEVPNSSSLEDVQEGNYSIAAWFRPNSVPPGSGSANDAMYAIVMKEGTHVGLRYYYDQKFVMDAPRTGSVSASAGTWSDSYPPGRYYHVVGVVDRDGGTVKIYLDGELKNTAVFTVGEAAHEYDQAPWRVGIAAPGASDWGWAADGDIDDVRIYSHALNEAEIAEIYGLVGRWKLDESSGTVAADSSGIGNDGVYSATVELGQSVPELAEGPTGVRFNNWDVVTIPPNDAYQVEDGVAISAWVYAEGGDDRFQVLGFANNDAYSLVVDSDETPDMELNLGSPTGYIGTFSGGTTTKVPQSSWRHVAASFDGEQVTYYVNGIAVDTAAASGLTLGYDAENLLLGACGDTTVAGRLHDVRLYNRGITPEEARSLFYGDNTPGLRIISWLEVANP